MTDNKGCTHKWIVNNRNTGTCSLCGEVCQFPLEKGEQIVVLKKGNQHDKSQRGKKQPHGNLHERSRYYESNKEAIIADLLSMGRLATRTKWEIPKGTLGKLERRWLTNPQRASVTTAGQGGPEGQVPELPRSGNGRLPHLPEFSNTWEAPVQLKWLEIYDKLIDREVKK